MPSASKVVDGEGVKFHFLLTKEARKWNEAPAKGVKLNSDAIFGRVRIEEPLTLNGHFFRVNKK